MAHAEGTFTLTGFEEETYAELDGGGKLTQATIGQDFAGELEASMTSRDLMAYTADGSAEIVGLARVEGTLAGRSGSFVVRETGSYDGERMTGHWTVVVGSGTGELSGLTGTGSTAAPKGPNGTWTFDYELG